jgi:hypothetical protein
MLRTAKVICQSGEYICLVRDVSAGGTKLQFFHAVPPEKRIFLELANGALHPVERVWADGGADHCEAGYRFAAPVALEQFLSEASQFAHRAIRLRLQVPVLLTVDAHDFRAMLADVSRCGAKLTVDRRLPQGAFARFDATGLPLRFGHIRWRNNNDHGIVFQEAIPLEELARCLFALQPSVEGLEQEQAADRKAIRAA